MPACRGSRSRIGCLTTTVWRCSARSSSATFTASSASWASGPETLGSAAVLRALASGWATLQLSR